MFNTLEKKLDTAINARLTGAILLSDADSSEANEELKDLMAVADRLASVQFADVPEPSKRRLYITALDTTEKHYTRSRWLRIMSWPASLALMGLVTIITFTQSQESTAGSTFFNIKKLSEQAQLWAVKDNPQKLAQTQLHITEKRLNETARIVASADVDEKTKTAALNELSQQAKTTLPLIKSAVEAKKNDQRLITSLESLSSKLSTLQKDTDTNSNTGAITTELADATRKTTDEVKELVGIASSSDPGTLTLAKETGVEVNGKITSLASGKIVVEKTVFTYDSEKIIIRKLQTQLSIKDLFLKQSINVKGVRNSDGSLVAQEITIVPVIPTPKVESTTSTKVPSDIITTPVPPPVKTDTVQTGLIIEPPASLEN